jgi:beta-N-acetylhexosaminidase
MTAPTSPSMTLRPVDVGAAPFSLDADDRAWVEQTLSGMTLEQKIGQLLCLYMRTDDVPFWWRQLQADGIEPGGVLMLPRTSAQARDDVSRLQALSPVPLLVAANLESGAVNFLTDAEAFANPMQLAATGDITAVELLARHCARIAYDVGINWAFAPVVDVAVNPANPITNTRTFGEDVQTVATFGSAYIRALEQRSIVTSPKHFPGDGVDGRDQHLVTSSNDLDLDAWQTTFGDVYRAVIAAGARTIMVGHIRQPALSRSLRPEIEPHEIMPASLAPELLGDVLRDQLGFNGLIVSDNSAMTGFTSVMTRRQALPTALRAGIDMILGSLSVLDDFEILLDTARSGALSIERLDDAVRRTLATKASAGLHRPTTRDPGELGSKEIDIIARDDVARRSVTLVKDTQRLIPLDPATHSRALVFVVGDEPTFYDPSGPFAPQFIEGLRARGLAVDVLKVPSERGDPAAAEQLHERYDVCLYFVNLRFTGSSNGFRIAWTPWQGHDAPRHVASLPTALVSIADPYVLQDVPMIRTAINGYTPTPSTVDAALAVLFGEQTAQGQSPIDPFVGHWDAAL